MARRKMGYGLICIVPSLENFMLPREIESVSHDIFGGLYRGEPSPNWQSIGRQHIRPQQMPNVWSTPVYPLVAKTGKRIIVDVTSSVSAGLPPNKLFGDMLIKFFRNKGVESVVDFGAGALRHTFPLLHAGFQVCAVEFEEQFKKPACAEALREAQRHANFCKLIWPRDFRRDRRRFDAALLCYVLQTMPLQEERKLVLKLLRNKLSDSSYLLLMSRYGQISGIAREQSVKDGYFMWPDREVHSFYTEFTTEETHKMIGDYGFRRLRSLSERGTDQVFLYGKGSSTWI